MSEPFEGFEFTVKRKREYVHEEKEESKKSGIDKSLEELANRKQQKKETKVLRRYSDSSDDEQGPRREVVRLRMPREVVQQIAQRAGIDIKGYYATIEAVVTRR